MHEKNTQKSSKTTTEDCQQYARNLLEGPGKIPDSELACELLLELIHRIQPEFDANNNPRLLTAKLLVDEKCNPIRLSKLFDEWCTHFSTDELTTNQLLIKKIAAFHRLLAKIIPIRDRFYLIEIAKQIREAEKSSLNETVVLPIEKYSSYERLVQNDSLTFFAPRDINPRLLKFIIEETIQSWTVLRESATPRDVITVLSTKIPSKVRDLGFNFEHEPIIYMDFSKPHLTETLIPHEIAHAVSLVEGEKRILSKIVEEGFAQFTAEQQYMKSTELARMSEQNLQRLLTISKKTTPDKLLKTLVKFQDINNSALHYLIGYVLFHELSENDYFRKKIRSQATINGRFRKKYGYLLHVITLMQQSEHSFVDEVNQTYNEAGHIEYVLKSLLSFSEEDMLKLQVGMQRRITHITQNFNQLINKPVIPIPDIEVDLPKLMR